MLIEFAMRGTSLSASIMSSILSKRCASVTFNSHKREHPLAGTPFLPTRKYSSRLVASQLTHPGYPGVCYQQLPLPYRQLDILLGLRHFSKSPRHGQKSKAVMEKRTETTSQQLTMGQRVAQTSKDVSYAGIIVLGIGVTAIMFYTIGKELFSSNSPNGIYSNALKLCKKNVEIQDALGTPIKGYGEMTRRKRRRHVSHLEYSQEGMNFMRMKFYLEGPNSKGTVHLEMKENENGSYEYRYLFVDLGGYPSRTIILEDNRK